MALGQYKATAGVDMSSLGTVGKATASDAFIAEAEKARALLSYADALERQTAKMGDLEKAVAEQTAAAKGCAAEIAKAVDDIRVRAKKDEAAAREAAASASNELRQAAERLAAANDKLAEAATVSAEQRIGKVDGALKDRWAAAEALDEEIRRSLRDSVARYDEGLDALRRGATRLAAALGAAVAVAVAVAVFSLVVSLSTLPVMRSIAGDNAGLLTCVLFIIAITCGYLVGHRS